MAKEKPAKDKNRESEKLVTRRHCGPEPERLKIRGDWKAAVSRALRTPRPPGGWPK